MQAINPSLFIAMEMLLYFGCKGTKKKMKQKEKHMKHNLYIINKHEIE